VRSLLKRGRSVPFANPALSALDARHVWLPDAASSVIPTAAKSIDVATHSEVSIFLPDLPSLEHILIDAVGRQHVVLRGNGAAIQLMIEGSDVIKGLVDLTFLVRGFDTIRAACTHLATLDRILAPPSPPPARPRWTAAARKLRDTLVTLDGRIAGASYHEIALILYGTDYVNRNWRTGLKERIRRHYNRGLALSADGYRKLLRKT
jgi:hypothetical protein